MEDDDYYGSDDGFDALPANTLAQLEEDALESTQYQRAREAVPQKNNRPQYQQPAKNDDQVLDRQQPPAEYGLDDEEVLDLDAFPQDVQQALSQWPQKPAQVQDRAVNGQRPPRRDADGDHLMVMTDLAELQRRIQELESENTNLQSAISEAQSIAQSKTGEASLLRQRVDKNAKEYEHKIQIMRREHTETNLRQRAEVAVLQRDREKVATDNRFLAHDLVVEAGRNRQARPVQKTNGHESPGTTPKKAKTLPYRDGFDDDDIMLLSPSRARSTSKTSTPKAVGKRKREPPPQSPVRPLVLRPVEPSPRSREEAAKELKYRVELQRRINRADGKGRLMRRLIEYASQYAKTDVRLIDTLSTFALPLSEERPNRDKRNFASIFLDIASRTAPEEDDKEPATLICGIFVDLLDQCLTRAYHDPVNVLIEIISVIAANQGLSFAKTLIPKTVPLVIAACDLVAFPIARAAIKQTSSTNDTAKSPSTPDIDVLQGISLLQTVASACAFDIEAARTFWRLPSFEFMMVMLMKAQPLEQILAMLQLLGTSVLPDSLGVVSSSTSTRGGSREADTVNRLSLLLSEKFVVSPPQKAKTVVKKSTSKPQQVEQTVTALEQAEADFQREETILQIQLQIASIFLSLCTTTHGTTLIATHRQALARLVRYLHNSITALYTFNSFTHDYHISAINTIMRVIHHVMTTQGSALDIREKIRNVPGGTQMWLLALTRLAFMEGIEAEEGIEGGTSDMAHQLLDEYLSPDEGEMLLQVFSTGLSAD